MARGMHQTLASVGKQDSFARLPSQAPIAQLAEQLTLNQ